MDFVQAANYTRGRGGVAADLLVIHTAQTPPADHAAHAVASFFQHQEPSPNGSSGHVTVGATDTCQSVLLADKAWGAPGANTRGLHLELIAWAEWSPAEWAANDALLTWGASIVAQWVGLSKFVGRPIPVRRLAPSEVAAGVSGICGHIDVTHAYPGQGTHTDPGPWFPWQTFLDKVSWWVSQFEVNGWPPLGMR